MFNTLTGLALTLLTSLIIILADWSIKLAADGDATLTSRPMLAGYVLYGLSAVLWFFTMRHVPLGQAAVCYSMFSLIGLFVTGVVIFGESADWRDYSGLGLALGAMALMVR